MFRVSLLFKLALSAEHVSCLPSGPKTFEVVIDFWKICVPRRRTFQLVPAGLNAVRVRELIKWLDYELGHPWPRESVGMAF